METMRADSSQEQVGQPSSKGTVAFLGPVASFTHQVGLSKDKSRPSLMFQATLQDFPEGTGWKYLPCRTVKDILDAVHQSNASHGVVPFENSTYGPVVDTFDLLATAPTSYPALSVIAESYIAVHHALVGRRPREHRALQSSASSAPPAPSHPAVTRRAPSLLSTSGTATPTPSQPHPPPPRSKPVTNLSHITRVLSHPQAFGQCAAFLGAYLKQAERQETPSTAAAAAHVAEHDGIHEAAIASEAAAGFRGLDVLAAEIEDKVGNRTRFVTVSRRAGRDEGARSGGSPVDGKNAAFKTLISFTLRPAAPAGALADALAAFTTHGLSLRSIHSRPSGRRAWDYVFFVECESEGGEEMDERVRGAMQVLKDRVEACFGHGRYKARE